MVSFRLTNQMLVFSERRRLAAMFEKWAEDNDAANSPINVIAYLQTIGAIDNKRAREAIENNGKVRKD